MLRPTFVEKRGQSEDKFNLQSANLKQNLVGWISKEFSSKRTMRENKVCRKLCGHIVGPENACLNWGLRFVHMIEDNRVQGQAQMRGTQAIIS